MFNGIRRAAQKSVMTVSSWYRIPEKVGCVMFIVINRAWTDLRFWQCLLVWHCVLANNTTISIILCARFT